MSLYDKISNPESLKKELLQVTFFITLYENFKSFWENDILSFFANSVHFDNGKEEFRFVKPNPDKPDDIIDDKEAENEYKKKVYQTVKRKNGSNDREASMFKWMLDCYLITNEYYMNLLEFRDLRNKFVHELDDLLNNGIPNNIEDKIKKLIEIRKYSTKQWFIYVELPTSGEAKFDKDGNIIIPDTVYSNVDLSFDLLYDAIFK